MSLKQKFLQYSEQESTVTKSLTFTFLLLESSEISSFCKIIPISIARWEKPYLNNLLKDLRVELGSLLCLDYQVRTGDLLRGVKLVGQGEEIHCRNL